MTTFVTLSSQGQIVISVRLRRILGVKPGEGLKLRLLMRSAIPTVLIEAPTKSWTKRVTGAAKGVYGDVDEYLKKERSTWD